MVGKDRHRERRLVGRVPESGQRERGGQWIGSFTSYIPEMTSAES